MSDHLVLYVDRLVRPAEEVGSSSGSSSGPEIAGPSCDHHDHHDHGDDDERIEVCSDGSDGDEEEEGEKKPLIEMAECRICQEEDSVSNLENPCACSGSLKV